MFVTPCQHHNGNAAEIYRRRAVVYEHARQLNPGDGQDPHSAGMTG